MSENKIELYPFQQKAAEYIRDHILNQIDKPTPPGLLKVCPAGTGKTYGEAWALAEAIKRMPHKPTAFSDVLWLTPDNVRIQSIRVLTEAGVSDRVQVIPYSSITSSFGEEFGSWASRLVRGEIDYDFVWDKDLAPNLIVCDECQELKNPDSLRAKVVIAAIKQGIQVHFMSATPFANLKESQTVMMGLRLCNEYTFKNFISHFARGKRIDEYCPAAMKALNEYLIDRGLKVEYHGIKFKKRCFNKVRVVPFESPAHQQFYEEAYQRYLEVLAKTNKHEPQGVRKIWVEMQKFKQAAEMIRSGLLARMAHEFWQNGKQLILPTSYVDTQDLIKSCLMSKFKVKEEQISIIRGGQKTRERQLNIDRFQNGKAQFCLLTMKSGGAGLSLHHDRELPGCKPRHIILPPTWSAIELVQVLGRGHRINSISTTYQDIVWYEGTIEEHVAAKVEIKLKSLKEIVSKRETWVDLFSKISETEARVIEEEYLRENAVDEAGNIFLDEVPLDALAEAAAE